MNKKKQKPAKRDRKAGGIILLVAALSFAVVFLPSQNAAAFCCICADCDLPPNAGGPIDSIIEDDHEENEPELEEHIVEEFIEHRDWLTDDFLRNNIPRTLMQMTEQMSAVAIFQAKVAGMLLDAQHQLETQRLFHRLQNEAHRDYHPSEDFCWFGTNVRSMANSESRAHYNMLALEERALARHLGNVNLAGAPNADDELAGRWARFRTDYCDPQDNNFQGAGTGLTLACGGGAADPNRVNRDIDYTRMVDQPRTINLDLTNATLTAGGDEEDVMALANNLYGHRLLSRQANETFLKNKQGQHLYLALRSVAAKRSVAENSFNAIVGLKSSGTSNVPGSAPQTRQFLAAVLAELGVDDENGDGSNADEIYGIIGTRPSYYAQLEILAKKIYQNPDFYANLYDRPANIARKAVALKAIEMMLDRALYESEMRQEMLMSVLLASEMRGEFRDINKDMVTMGSN